MPILPENCLRVTHPFATALPKYCYLNKTVRLACLIHAASVRSEPESNSPLKTLATVFVAHFQIQRAKEASQTIYRLGPFVFRPAVEVRGVLKPAPSPVKPFLKDFCQTTPAPPPQPPPTEAPMASPRSAPTLPRALPAHPSMTAPPSRIGAAHAQEPTREFKYCLWA